MTTEVSKDYAWAWSVECCRQISMFC